MVAFSTGALGSMGAAKVASMAGSSWGPAAASIAGNVLGAAFGDDDNFSRKDYLYQLNTQHGLNIRDALERPRAMVHGAKHAGIHPALLFGGSAMSPPSWNVGSTGGGYNSTGYHFANIGQDISRALYADMSLKERRQEAAEAVARTKAMDALNLERHKSDLTESNLRNVNTGLQNDLLRLQILKAGAPGTPPPRPSNTRGGVSVSPTGAHVIKPAEITSARPNGSETAGPAAPGFTDYRLGGKNIGYNLSLPAGSSMSEALESLGAPVSLMHTLGHQTALSFDKHFFGGSTPKTQLPSSHEWKWSWTHQKYYARPKKGWQRIPKHVYTP